MSDRFAQKRQTRAPRDFEQRSPKAHSYLIVTEGAKTEPMYFEGLIRKIQHHVSGNLTVERAPIIDVSGEGRSTMGLVRETERIAARAHILYQHIWVVMDKDDFDDFDEAIAFAEEKGYHVAWSNECFEYWIYLHFDYMDRPISRFDLFRELNRIFYKLDIGSGRYRKNYRSLYRMLERNDGVNIALANAKRRMKDFDPKRHKPSQYNPGTTVHLLIEQLRNYLPE